MKFLVDAQLPRRLCYWLREQGHDALHTLDLESGNRTTDLEVIRIADRDGRFVITKDDDFVQSFLLRKFPRRLMLIALGNVGNAELERLIAEAWPAIVDVLETAHFIEISKKSLIVHE